MGTTLIALALVVGADGGERLAMANVGDSRAYRIRDGQLEQMTEDHSLVESLVRQGRITAEEAVTHPQRNIITRALGVDPQVEVDSWRCPPSRVTGSCRAATASSTRSSPTPSPPHRAMTLTTALPSSCARQRGGAQHSASSSTCSTGLGVLTCQSAGVASSRPLVGPATADAGGPVLPMRAGAAPASDPPTAVRPAADRRGRRHRVVEVPENEAEGRGAGAHRTCPTTSTTNPRLAAACRTCRFTWRVLALWPPGHRGGRWSTTAATPTRGLDGDDQVTIFKGRPESS
jgi:hypothetical protein